MCDTGSKRKEQTSVSFYTRKCTNTLQSKIYVPNLFSDTKVVISTHQS